MNPKASRNLDRPFESCESLNIIRHRFGIMSLTDVSFVGTWLYLQGEASVNSKPPDPLLRLAEHPLELEGRPTPGNSQARDLQ